MKHPASPWKWKMKGKGGRVKAEETINGNSSTGEEDFTSSGMTPWYVVRKKTLRIHVAVKLAVNTLKQIRQRKNEAEHLYRNVIWNPVHVRRRQWPESKNIVQLKLLPKRVDSKVRKQLLFFPLFSCSLCVCVLLLFNGEKTAKNQNHKKTHLACVNRDMRYKGRRGHWRWRQCHVVSRLLPVWKVFYNDTVFQTVTELSGPSLLAWHCSPSIFLFLCRPTLVADVASDRHLLTYCQNELMVPRHKLSVRAGLLQRCSSVHLWNSLALLPAWSGRWT